jgi:hypothetical protein
LQCIIATPCLFGEGKRCRSGLGEKVTLIRSESISQRAQSQILAEAMQGHPVCLVKQLCPSVGEARCLHNVRLLGQALGPVHLALACPADHPDDPWSAFQ